MVSVFAAATDRPAPVARVSTPPSRTVFSLSASVAVPFTAMVLALVNVCVTPVG